MVLQKGFWVYSFLTLLLLGCSLSSATDKGPDFKVKNITLGSKKLKVAIADTRKKRNYGLMHRKSWGEWQGVLFVFNNESKRSFWMKNTLLPLSIGFLNSEGVLLEFHDMNPPKSVFQKTVDRAFSKWPAKYALEVPQGWFKKHNIKAGPKGSKLIILD